MRIISLFCLCLAIVATPVLAQETPKAELFGGYQYTHAEGQDLNGWNASIAGNLNNWFGVAADFSGAYKTISGVSVKAHTYTFGPVFSYRANDRITPFAHVLVGGVHLSGSGFGLSGSTNGFAIQAGGGADLKINNRFAVRLAQVDWEGFHANGTWSSKDVRVSTGIVVRF
jgi:hypothetical protein